ncbi:MAG: sigma 54-interacting transcriptional regulator [Methylococcales bacterium]|jgi:two-component system, NtrC family, response regulator HydG|nr:sigma 54-interacting transcriptional regulator [Methylococcales bacterium]MBT7408283.1 sigma 54-interacting transcriptional regulator [Methylococcales bacterium]
MPFDLITLEGVLNSFSCPVILIDNDYTIVVANQIYQRRYKFNKQKHAPKCYEISHQYKMPCDLAGETCPLKLCRETNALQKSLHIHHTHQGEEHVDVHMQPIMDENNKIKFYLEILHDVPCAGTQSNSGKLIGRSKAFKDLISMIQRVANHDVNVLLLGESGTGKELVAKAIHDSSDRADKPFVPVDCSGLSENLFESELFGHEKGSFTGAQHKKTGLIEAAEGGTLFLDETGDIPLGLQTKLLRLLETNTYRRVGGIDPIQSNFRLICATHRNIKKMVKEGSFRNDLYFRINTFPIYLPTVKERIDDLPLLSRSLLNRFNRDDSVTLSERALEVLMNYDFPGNIRELYNILQRASIMADGNVILPMHLPEDLFPEQALQERFEYHEVQPIENIEAEYLKWAVTTYQGDRKSLAALLGMSERTLYRKVKDIIPS